MKKVRRVYLSGPMTGKEDLNFPAFDKARDKLIALGYWVVSPADLERNRPVMTYEKALQDDILHLMNCNTIYLLRGWNDSRGARLEWFVAVSLGFEVMYET
jgi:hypothetical protein